MTETTVSRLPASGRLWLLVASFVVWTLSCPVYAAGAPRILLFTKTSGFTHGSIPAAVAALRTFAEDDGFVVDDSADAALFTTAGLAPYQAVVFLMTTGNILDAAQQSAFEDYIRAGNGYAGVHSATDTEYDWPWYGDLVGAYFDSHPSIQQATINVEDAAHPSTEGLATPWVRTDEWYNFRSNPRASVNVLATLDESTYNGGNMGDDHPIAWYHEFDGGRAWYTAGGHTDASYSEPEFLQHILGGLRYAAGISQDADADADGVLDSADNCQNVPNADQRDSNGDLYGNVCDSDLNDDCVVNAVDLGILKNVFFSGDPNADSNGDGLVNAVDLGVMKVNFFAAPGPSGQTSACASVLR